MDAEARKLINVALRETVDAASVELYADDAPRTHLGASVIGEDCAAKMWFGFRWSKQGHFTGQQYRLFNTGHLYEARFAEWYRAAGFEVFSFDENGKQWRITACEGHFGGSMDGGAIYRGVNLEMLTRVVGAEKANALAVALAPLLNIPVILEFKTHNKKNFDKLTKHGVRLAYPKHHTQYSTYGTFYGLTYSIYAGYCKDNDEFWPEVHVNDAALCQDMVRKAWEIIQAQTRPPRISEDPVYYECKYCSFVDICHHNAPMAKNCRSCRHAKAGPEKSWICTFWDGKTIPPDYIPQGCGQWAQIE